MTLRRSPLALAGLLVPLLIVVAGCSGDSGEPSEPTSGSTAGEKSGTPTPSEEPKATPDGPVAQESVEDAVARLEQLPRAGTCEEQLAYLRSFGPDGQPEVSDTDCEIAAQIAQDIAQITPFRDARSEAFGIGAVTSITTDSGHEVLTWTLDTDGLYKFANRFAVTEPELDTTPQDSGAFDESVAQQWLDAIRTRDCATVYRLIVSDSPKVQGRTQADFCPLLETAYETPGSFMNRVLEGSEPLEPQFFGGTENVGFFGVRLAEESYYVILTTTASSDVASGGHAPYGVTDYVPVQRPAD